MKKDTFADSGPLVIDQLPEPLKEPLMILLRAYNYAQQLQEDVWTFAEGIDYLARLGMSPGDLRWLACRGYVQHAREVTRPSDLHRSFRTETGLMITARTYVVLTDLGAAVARQFSDPGLAADESAHAGPCWDAALRELRVGPQLVKRFAQPAPNQETILEVFEEEGWPRLILDPLPPVRGQDVKRRLHTTINNLNRCHRERLIRFGGSGDGQGIVWRLLRPGPA